MLRTISILCLWGDILDFWAKEMLMIIFMILVNLQRRMISCFVIIISGDDLVESCKSGSKILFATSGQTKNSSDCHSPFYWKPFKTNNIPVQYTGWHAKEPNCHTVGESCLEYVYANQSGNSFQFKWNDNECTRAVCMLCEYELN